MRTKPATQKDISPGIICTAPWRVAKVKAMPNYTLEVEFNDGTHGFVEMQEFILSDKAGVFSALRNVDLFKKVYIEYGTVTWPGEIDLAPDAMYQEIMRTEWWKI